MDEPTSYITDFRIQFLFKDCIPHLRPICQHTLWGTFCIYTKTDICVSVKTLPKVLNHFS